MKTRLLTATATMEARQAAARFEALIASSRVGRHAALDYSAAILGASAAYKRRFLAAGMN